MYKGLFLLVVSIVLISACQSTKRVVVESEYLRAVIRTGAPVDNLTTGELSDQELVVMTNSLNVFQNFIDKWETPIDALEHGGSELKNDYIQVRKAYSNAYEIVVLKWNTYTKEQQEMFIEWHAHATKLDNAAMDYMKLEKYVNMVDDIIIYGRIGISLITKTPL